MTTAVDVSVLGRQLAVGEWMKIPSGTARTLSAVYATPNPDGSAVQTSIMTAYSGGCYDYFRMRMNVTGGGHTDYKGNEMYDFCLDSASSDFLKWRLKLYYSAHPGGAGNYDVYGDGSPGARHTYDGMIYNRSRDKIVILPGGSTTVNGSASNTIWELDASVFSPSVASPSSWSLAGTAVGADLSLPAGYDPVGGVGYMLGISGGVESPGIYSVNGASTKLTGNESHEFGRTGAIATLTAGARYMFSHHTPDLGGTGQVKVRRLDLGTYLFIGAGTHNEQVFTGNTEVKDASNMSMDWDDNGQQMICWAGDQGGGSNRNYYTLASPFTALTRQAGTGDVPTAPTSQGVYGRFCYLGWDGVNTGLFFLVNQTTEEPYILRTSASSSPTTQYAVILR